MSDTLRARTEALAQDWQSEVDNEQSLRVSAEAKSADLASQVNVARDAATTLQATLAKAVEENAALRKQLESGGSGVPQWTPGTVLRPYTSYLLPMVGSLAAPIFVDVPGVTFLFGWLAPMPGNSVITFRAGGTAGTVQGTTFNVPNAPTTTAKLGVKPAIGCGVGTRVYGCAADNVDTFVEMLAPDGSLVMDGNKGTGNVRAGFLYCGGGRRVVFTNNEAADSQNENLVRFSPQLAAVPDEIVIAFNKLANPGNKAVIEIRSGSNVVVYRNDLTASWGHTCIGVGREDLADGPGATRVRVTDNVCHGGRIEIDPGAADVVIEGNQLYDLRYGTIDKKPERDSYDIGIIANGKMGTLKDLRVVGNRGYIGGPTIKPFFTIGTGGNVPGLVEADNQWVLPAPPVTVAGGLGHG